MVELHHIFVILYAGTAVLALAVAAVSWRRRAARGGLPLAVLMSGIAVWSGACAVMWYVPAMEEQVFWLGATFLGVWIVPVAVMLLALDIARLGRWRTPIIAILSAISFVFLGIAWLNPGRLYNTAFIAWAVGPYTHYEAVTGPFYMAYNVFAFATIVAALVIVFRVYLRSSGTERTQAVVILVGGLVPVVSAALTESRMVSLAGLDLAPLAFLVTGALWLAAILRGTMLDVLPVARGALIEQMSDGVLVLDGEDRVVDTNPAALTILRTPLARVLGKSAETVFSVVPGATAVLRGSGPRCAALSIGPKGDSRCVQLRIMPLIVGPGRPPAQLVTLHDATEERRISERLKLAGQVFDTANEAIIVTLLSADQPIIEVNDAFCRLTGHSRDDTIGKDIRPFRSDRHPPEFYTAIEEALLATGEWQGEVWQTRVDGTEFPSLVSLSMTEDKQEHVERMVTVFTDITEIREVEEQVRHLATHDALTGLPNRRLFEAETERAAAFAKRGTVSTILFTDVDQFKTCNDVLGHAVGDEVLHEIAQGMKDVVRETDTVARIGGDEFGIVLWGQIGKEVAEISQRLSDAVTAVGLKYGSNIGLSIGAATLTAGADASSVLAETDRPMYEAKASD